MRNTLVSHRAVIHQEMLCTATQTPLLRQSNSLCHILQVHLNIVLQFCHGGHGLARHDQDMPHGDGPDVQKGNANIILVNEAGRNIPGNDVVEYGHFLSY